MSNKFSYYQSLFETKPNKEIDLFELLEIIKTEKNPLIDKIRAEQDKDKRDKRGPSIKGVSTLFVVDASAYRVLCKIKGY